MRKLTGVMIALAALALLGSRPVHAMAGLGFDVNGSFYQPRDSRYTGVGTDVGINMKVDDAFTMGYRVSELQVRGQDAAGATTLTNSQITFQGINAFYRVFNAAENKAGADLGLWMGSAATSNFGAAGATSLTSPFMEPMGRVSYSTQGKVEASVKFGIGYRFVRNWNLATPFGAGSSTLKDFDGLDINLGFGLGF